MGRLWKKAFGLVVLYVVGAVAVCGWSLSHVFAGTVTAENAAKVIVFPPAWIVGYWGVVAPLLAAHQVWRLQATLEDFARRRSLGLATDESEEELEDTLTLLLVSENPISERWARRMVRGFLARARRSGAPEAPPAT